MILHDTIPGPVGALRCLGLGDAMKKFPPEWELVRSERGPDLGLFHVRFDWMRNPRNAKLFRRLILETHDWVNVVARTQEGRIVVVRQYRFGTGHLTSEIPGGMVEPGEDHREAAVRELREESGFTSERWIYLGAVEPNPAIMNNRCHQWLAEEAVQSAPLSPDEGEDITVETLSIPEIREEIRQGFFCHSLAILALYRALDLWESERPTNETPSG